MLDEVENAIGHDRLKIFHSHFSKIMFTNPGGEKKHLTLTIIKALDLTMSRLWR